LSTETSLPLTFNSAVATSPRYSPDGSKIVFISNRDRNSEIYVMNSDGTNQTRLANTPVPDAVTAWSPDGKRIVYTNANIGSDSGIYVMNADGSNPVRITSGFGATWRVPVNPNDFSSFFVRQHYLDFLNREPD